MHLPEPIILIFSQFQPLLSAPSYRKMVLLVCGTLLAHGRRTVTAALKMLGLTEEHNRSKYHNLLNRAKYSGLGAAAFMLRLLVKTFLAPNAPIEIVMDETLERRWGRKIKKRGHWRDTLASSHKQNVTTSGLRWLVAALVVKLPWSSRPWALPFFSTILTTPKRSVELKLRHRTVTGRTSQLVMRLHRLFKGTGRTIKLIGDVPTASSNWDCCVKSSASFYWPRSEWMPGCLRRLHPGNLILWVVPGGLGEGCLCCKNWQQTSLWIGS